MQNKQELNPDDVAVWIFDLDNTLYSVHCDLGVQLGQRMGEFVARFLDLPLEEARLVQKLFSRSWHNVARDDAGTRHASRRISQLCP